MRILFVGLEPKAIPQPMPLEVFPNISVDIEVLPSLEQWALVMHQDIAMPLKPSFGQQEAFGTTKAPTLGSLIWSESRRIQ